MGERHKLTVEGGTVYWQARCECEWFNAYITEAEARAAYEEHVYQSYGREAVGLLRGVEAGEVYVEIAPFLASIDEALEQSCPVCGKGRGERGVEGIRANPGYILCQSDFHQ